MKTTNAERQGFCPDNRLVFDRRRLLHAGAGLAGGVLAFGGPGLHGWSPAVAAITPQTGGALGISLYGDVDTFDPILATDNRSIWTMNLIYDTLVRLAADGETFEPALAERWEASADGLTYTFHLREAAFQDGTPVTAEDVAFSLDRAMNSPGSQSSALYPPSTTLATPDARTVVAQLTTTWGSFLAGIAYYAAAIIPKVPYQTQKALFFDRPIGSGPFQLNTWEKGVRLELVKNPTYWQEGRPYLDGVTVVVQPDPAAREAQFRDGTLDIFAEVPFGNVAAMRADPNITMLVEPVNSALYLSLNVMRAPLDDADVRRAISSAIDRNEIVEKVTMGAASPATTYLPDGIPLHDESAANYGYDLERAKALLATTGGKNGFKLTMIAIKGDPFWGAAATAIAAQLANIGIEVTIPEVEQLGDLVQAGAYDLMLGQMIGSEHDPDELTTYLIRSDLSGNGSNYASPEFDKLAVDAQRIADPAQRAQAYRKLQAIVSEDAPLVVLCSPSARTATTARVQDFHILPDGSYRLWETWRAPS